MRFLALSCSVMFFFCELAAQDVRVRAWLDTASMRIGEQTRLRLSIEHRPGIQVQFPFVADSLVSKVEVIDRSAIDSSMQGGGKVLQRQTFTVTAFDAGLYEIPPLTFTYRKPNDQAEYSIQTQALTLSVAGVQVPPPPQIQDSTQADEQDNLRDIKPPIAVPLTFWEVAPYLAAGLLLVGTVVWGIRYYRKRRAERLANAPVPQIPQRPPFEVAMEALEKLDEQRLWQSGAVKEYHTELSEILRVYLEGTYRVTTLEATTDEILDELRGKFCPPQIVEMVKKVLTKADMVKFAKYEPVPDENEVGMRLAREVVQITALKTETEKEQGDRA